MEIEEAMELLKRVAVHIPMTAACVVLMIAAIGKAGREAGASVFMLGAIGLCVLSIASPVFYELIVPKLLNSMDVPEREKFFEIVAWTSRMLWSGAILSLAVGVFMRRSSRIDRQRLDPPMPMDFQIRD